jgi:undecaprenyl-diphosphatase
MRMAFPQSVRNRFDPTGRYGLRVTLIAIATVLVAVPFSFLLLQVLRQGPVTRVDRGAAQRLFEIATNHPALVRPLKAISLLGKPLWLAFAVAAGAAYAAWRGRRRLALYLVVTAIGGGLVDSAVKLLVNRPRPDVGDPLVYAFGKSFPSGHAMSSTVTYGALLLVFLPILSRRARFAAFVGTAALLVAIGLSRLLLGVHYISDVIAGWVLGLAWLTGSTAAFSIWRKEEGREPVHPTEGLEPEAAADLSPTSDGPTARSK